VTLEPPATSERGSPPPRGERDDRGSSSTDGTDAFRPKRRTSGSCVKVEGRRNSLRQLRDNLTRTFKANTSRRKKSLSHWSNFSTVSWRKDAEKDFLQHTSLTINRESSWWQKSVVWIVSWCLPGLIGFSTAVCGSLLEWGCEWFSDLRFGYCATRYPFQFQTVESCPGLNVTNASSLQPGWVRWSHTKDHHPLESLDPTGLLFYVVISVALAAVSGLLVRYVAPTARGSGIPEVKTILGGFVMPDVLNFKTLLVKIVGLAMSVSSGMALGKEGPLVHIACCWANILSRFSKRYMANEAKRRELISTAAAAGVGVAFGAPLGGVLFSFEEVSTMFPQKTMIRAFFAAIVATLTLAQINPTGSKNGKLTMFQASYNDPPEFLEYFWFLLIGVLGGLIGSLFVYLNVEVSGHRQKGRWWARKVPPVLEVMLIAGATALTSYYLHFTRVLSSVQIRSLFHSCENEVESIDMFGLCSDDGIRPLLTMHLVFTLLVSSVIRFVQMTFTFGTGVPCGLFVPCLYVGATLGRTIGVVAGMLNTSVYPFTAKVYPGVYAMIGAAAVLGGVCRVTISLVVIMFELTGGLQLVVPFMIAVLTAKFVGDAFTGGIYDCYIRLRGYPYLHEPDEVSYHAKACNIMDDELDCIHVEPPGSLGTLLDELTKKKHGGFPLIMSETDKTLIGYLHTQDLKKHLEDELEQSAFVNEDTIVAFQQWRQTRNNHHMDLSKFVDTTLIRLVPETPVAQVHNIFRQLGIKIILVTRFAELVGMITKKSFVDRLQDHDSRITVHMTDDPAVHMPRQRSNDKGSGLTEGLLP